MTEQVYEAARITSLNVLIRQVIARRPGWQDHALPELRHLHARHTEVHLVPNGHLLTDIFGPERGLGGPATICVMALASGTCSRLRSCSNWGMQSRTSNEPDLLDKWVVANSIVARPLLEALMELAAVFEGCTRSPSAWIAARGD